MLALLLLTAGATTGTDHIDGAAARQSLQRDGSLADVTVDGDLDLAGLRPADGDTLLLQSVTILGSLRHAPAAALEITGSQLGAWRSSHTVWHESITIERTTFAGRVGLDASRFTALSCRRCRFLGGVSARQARFGGETDFGFAEFRGPVDFSGATFHAAAFDGARFTDPGGALFNETDFVAAARFAGIDTNGGPILFRGAAFRDQALFAGCRIGLAVFAPADVTAAGRASNPFATDATIFGGVADFRHCRFGGGADFRTAALRAGARFDGAVLPRGVLDLRELTQAGGDIVLRDLRFGSEAAIAADESGIGDIVADRAAFAPALWHGLTPAALDALAGRAEALGAPVEARRLGFAAAAERAAKAGARWQDRVAWWLQWPTANYTDLARPILLAAAAWWIALLAAVPRGRLAWVVPAEAAAEPGVFARIVEPLYQPLDSAACERQAWCPATRRGRLAAAAVFAFALIFKLGSRRWRVARGDGWQPPVLMGLWLAGFVLIALIAATALQVLPGLRDLTDAMHA